MTNSSLDEYKLVELLIDKGYTVSTAESCTGGLIASTIINVPGCSAVYNEGFITYANSAKVKYLNVDEECINKYGVVSKEVVTQMAKGCAIATNSDVAIVTSGIAGPGGGSEYKPVGLVHMAVCVKGDVTARHMIFDGDRTEVRTKACAAAIKLAIESICEYEGRN